MKILSSLLALVLFTSTQADSNFNQQKINIKSELSSPIILEDSQEKNYLKISLTGFEIVDKSQRSPINLSLVIDRSTSMSGDKIRKAREAAIMAVNMLNKRDIISIIGYDTAAEVIIPATKIGNKKKLQQIINNEIQANGNTALFAGVSKGLYETKKFLNKNQVNRVILLSDGQANIGPSSTSALAELGRVAAKDGIAVTTIGLGNGYNEDLMAALAGYSDGNHVFVQNSSDLETAFNQEFSDVMSVVAQEVDVIIKLHDGVKPLRLLGRDGEITGQKVTVKLNQIYAKQEKYILLEVLPTTGKNKQNKELAMIDVHYKNMHTKQDENYSERVNIRYSKSKQIVKESLIEDVAADSTIQLNNLANQKAIELLDAGKADEAKALLSDNAAGLETFSAQLKDNRIKQKLTKKAKKLKTTAAEVNPQAPKAGRKMLKEEVFKTQKQQN